MRYVDLLHETTTTIVPLQALGSYLVAFCDSQGNGGVF
jgi:hypothetical protein